MYLLCVILIVLVSVLMCGIVMIQNSKGGGLAAGFNSSNQIMGVRKTTDFLEKATWTLAALIVVISIAAAYALPTKSPVVVNDPVNVNNTETAVPAAATTPVTAETPAETAVPVVPAADNK